MSKITHLLLLFPNSQVLQLCISSDPLAFAISFTRLSCKFWPIGSKLCSIILYLLINLLLCPPRIFKIILFWLMNFLIFINSKKGQGSLMAIKIDMEKAFDRMELRFILAILSKLGFHSTWNRICITSPSFSILINRSSFGLFNPKRGLRPRIPYLPFFLFWVLMFYLIF